MCIGSVMGPATRAPVRLAVSTMSLADLSRSEWSNALRRIRILVVEDIVGLFWRETGRGGGEEDIWGPVRLSSRLLVSFPSVSLSGFSAQDLGDDAGADGASAFADGEALLLLEGDRGDEVDGHLGVVARHDHLGPFGEGHRPGHVRRAHVELRTVV